MVKALVIEMSVNQGVILLPVYVQVLNLVALNVDQMVLKNLQ
jgi:hypothetical protein